MINTGHRMTGILGMTGCRRSQESSDAQEEDSQFNPPPFSLPSRSPTCMPLYLSSPYSIHASTHELFLISLYADLSISCSVMSIVFGITSPIHG